MTFPLVLERELLPHSSHKHTLRSNKLGIQFRLTVFEKHFDNLSQVRIQFIERGCLGMSTAETRDIAHVEICVRVPLLLL